VNAGFFATPSGVRVIEFNARFGDPEALNIMSLLESDWMNALRKIATGTLSSDDLTYAQKASVVTYLVAPPYPVASPDRFQFTVDEAAAEEAGVKIYFSSAIELSPGHYETLGTSRSVAVVATDDSVEKARAKVAAAINLSIRGGLEWRTDIGILPAE
jgi:phosphoribosylamine--glycine ligase